MRSASVRRKRMPALGCKARSGYAFALRFPSFVSHCRSGALRSRRIRKKAIFMGIAERYAEVEQEVARVCRACGRAPEDVRLIAVSKTVGVDGVASAVSAGAHDFGENRPDSLLPKASEFPQVTWHFIGNIQSRRIRDIVGSATLIHSLYQLKHAQKIDEVARELGKVQDVLIEVNVSGEESKSGLSPEEAPAFLAELSKMENLRARGLMTMAPQGDLARARRSFEGLARLADQMRCELDGARREAFDELSMGMSEDWREAIAAGATMVRIGRAIFSDEFKESAH